MKYKKYAKFIAQVTTIVVSSIIAGVVSDGHLTSSGWVNVIIAALGAITVLGAANLPAGVWSYTKSIVSGATTVAIVLSSVLSNGVSPTEWLQILTAIIGSLGVLVIPNSEVVPIVSVSSKAGRHEAKEA